MLDSKKKLIALIEFGRMVPVEKRNKLRINCRRFRKPSHMALGLLLDAIKIIDIKNIKSIIFSNLLVASLSFFAV